MKTPYQILGLSKTASAAEIKKAFRKLARKTHPDRNKAPDAEESFKAVNRAHEILSDPEKRALYDQFGEASLQSGFDPNYARQASRGGFQGGAQGFDMEDLLGSLFGGGAGFQQGPREQRAHLSIDFSTAALGGERDLTFGDGRSLKVRIPPGVRDGGSLRLRGKAPGGGDLILTLQVAPDPRFDRKGDDLYTVAEVTIGQALLGAQISVPTVKSPVLLRVPASSQNGQTLRVRGKGVARKGRSPGDLYVRLEVRLPTELDDEARQAIEVLERAYQRQSQAA